MSNIKEKYTFVSKAKDKWASICLVDGNFDGVIYKYGKVSIPEEEEENEEGNLPFRFEYDILDPCKLKQEDFGEEFFMLIGDILVDIIDEKIEDQQLGYTDD